MSDKPESACGVCTSMHSTGNVQRAAMPRDVALKTGTDEGGMELCLNTARQELTEEEYDKLLQVLNVTRDYTGDVTAGANIG